MHVPFVFSVKFYSLAQFPVDHLQSVVPDSILSLYQFVAFTHVFDGLIFVSTSPIITIFLGI